MFLLDKYLSYYIIFILLVSTLYVTKFVVFLEIRPGLFKAGLR